MRTVGVEEELLLVDRTTGVPVPVADAVLERAAAGGVPADGGAFVGEMHLEMLEAVTSPHETLASLGGQVLGNRATANRLAAAEGALAAPLASSPVSVSPHPRRTERYQRIVQRYGAVPRHCLTCGLHVHVAVESDAEGVAVLDRIRTWTPLLVALTANSPFSDDEDTGHASYRSIMWNQWPSAGPVDRFGSVSRYRAVTQAMLATETLLDAGMLYMDSRLSRDHPTVEVRVADVPFDPTMTVTVAGLVRALVDTAAEEWRDGRPGADAPACVVRLANWRAALEGLDGQLLDPVTARPVPAREAVLMLLEHVGRALTRNGDDQLVERVVNEAFVHGTGADRQRATHAATGELGAVALAAATARPTLLSFPGSEGPPSSAVR